MVKHGVPPYLECSSRGDRRFSAFYAIVNVQPLGFASIERHYQYAKVLEDGRTGLAIMEAKGHRAVNAEALELFYTGLWAYYMICNPELAPILRAATGLSDMFGQPGRVCQATELWRIKNAL